MFTNVIGAFFVLKLENNKIFQRANAKASYAANGPTLRLCSYMYHTGLFELELFEFSLFQAFWGRLLEAWLALTVG